MKWLFGSVVIAMLSTAALSEDSAPAASNVVLAIHGGVGSPKNELAEGEERQLRAVMEQALVEGRKVLRRESATSLDAVEAAIRILEDSPLFNAGKGAVFTDEGRNELDASIMEGRQKRAGSVAGVTILKNPISAARAVMEKSTHVMLIGRGAEVFATQAGLETVDPSYFWTLARWRQIEERWRRNKQPASEDQSSLPGEPGRHWGTVGAVALDRHGDLAAGTSTGGMSGKRFGRVGDSPIIGAGTYADNAGCAVSCTGHGEFFIRIGVAHEINALMKYQDLPVETAADRVVNETLKQAGGEGAAIALDAHGRFSAAFNTECLYRGWITREGAPQVRLFNE
jgi:L-asparaginase / beta-aspartyl-peptidase